VTSYEYDAAGRRVLETGEDLDRRYEWDAFGRLTNIDSDGRSTKVGVDVVGELAEFDGSTLLWDTTDPLQPLAWNGERAVIGERSPWALAGGDCAQWLAPDWQGTIGDAPRDPWGAVIGGAGAGGAGVELGYRGEVEFADDTWLRHRVYQPASRVFLGPDALAPVPGTAAAADPYHYAANDPIGRADPLGLRPVTEAELNKIRDSMDRNLLEKGRDAAVDVAEAGLDAAKWVGKQAIKHADTISLVAGVLAMVPTPLSPFLGAVSVGASLLSAGAALHNGDIGSAALSLVGAKLGVKGIFKGAQIKGLKNTLNVWKSENKVGPIAGIFRRTARREYKTGLAARKEVISAAKRENFNLGLQGTALSAGQMGAKEAGVPPEGQPLVPAPWR
jgi:RHS repeat-associated protein